MFKTENSWCIGPKQEGLYLRQKWSSCQRLQDGRPSYQENQVAAAATLEVTWEISAMELGPALQNVLARLVKVIFAR